MMAARAFSRDYPRAPWLLALLAAPALGGCMQTSTYGTGQMPEVAMFNEISGGLLGGKDAKEPIEYQPRAPLVMPPSVASLPAPMETAATSNPNWPVDPDGVTLASAAQLDDDPTNDVSQAEYRRLRPLADTLAANDRRTLNEPDGKDDYYRNIVHGEDARKQFEASINEANGIGRTERRYLTDPPNEFREPAATAPTEFEDVKKKKTSIFARMFGAG